MSRLGANFMATVGHCDGTMGGSLSSAKEGWDVGGWMEDGDRVGTVSVDGTSERTNDDTDDG